VCNVTVVFLRHSVVIDETMIPFCGRLSFRQYIPGKANKYGVKVFKLCDKYGYTFAFDLYAGKKDVENGLGLATSVVLKLAEPYLDAGRTLSTDNFYISLPLARALLHRKTHLVGILRANCKSLPETVCKKSTKEALSHTKARTELSCSSGMIKGMYTS